MLFPSLPLPLLTLARRMLATLVVCLLLGSIGAPAAAQFALPKPGRRAPQPAQTVDPETQALIELLENDAARERLIERLRGGAPVAGAGAVQVPFARQVAEHTRALAAQVSGVFLLAGNAAGARLGVLWRDTTQANVELMARTIGNLVLVVA
jgi:moderate conductance mechanosensitive channel